MCFLSQRGAAVILLTFLALHVGGAAPVQLPRQLITLPANATPPRFADLDGDGRSDLLVMDPVAKTISNYRQRPAGFTNSPDQVIPLPPQTAWAAPCDVDAHRGLELLISTATGLIYSRQNAGVFESERRTLIEASQLFTNHDFPLLTSLSTNKNGTNVMIPVISAGRIVLYHRDGAYHWSPKPPVTLAVKQTAWHVDRDPWMMGANRSHSLRVQQSFRTKPDQEQDQEPENAAIRKIVDDMEKAVAGHPPGTNRVDVDGDGREDLVLWRASAKLDFKTDLYFFRRGADQKLPEQATQRLHLGGLSIPIGSTQEPSPVGDLDGDGVAELVLLEPEIGVTSPSGFVEMLLSRGVDWSLKIRSFHRGAFSRNPARPVPVTILLELEELQEWPLFIQGDFNGDGRLDLLLRRTKTQWNILFSTTDGRWFAPQAALTFNAPANGHIEIDDLNGDGLADIIWHEPDVPRLSIFMSPRQGKGKNP